MCNSRWWIALLLALMFGCNSKEADADTWIKVQSTGVCGALSSGEQFRVTVNLTTRPFVDPSNTSVLQSVFIRRVTSTGTQVEVCGGQSGMTTVHTSKPTCDGTNTCVVFQCAPGAPAVVNTLAVVGSTGPAATLRCGNRPGPPFSGSDVTGFGTQPASGDTSNLQNNNVTPNTYRNGQIPSGTTPATTPYLAQMASGFTDNVVALAGAVAGIVLLVSLVAYASGVTAKVSK